MIRLIIIPNNSFFFVMDNELNIGFILANPTVTLFIIIITSAPHSNNDYILVSMH